MTKTSTMSDAITIDLQIATSANAYIPAEDKIYEWASAAANPFRKTAEMTVRVVDEAEIRDLNATYRHMDKVTNVLSFPAEVPEIVDLPLLGDVIICAAVVDQEAQEQGKLPDAHWAHMVVHGVLHLLGFDHEEDADAVEMESEEVKILKKLGFEDPYITLVKNIVENS